MKTLTKIGTGLALVACSAFLAACGSDTDTGTKASIIYKTSEDLPNCSANREGETETIKDGTKYICTDGAWEKVGKNSSSQDDEDDLPSCTSKNAGKKVQVDDDIYVCVDREWVEVYDVAESEDDMPKCGSKQEGRVVYVEETKEISKCVDGAWSVESEDEKTDDKSSASEGESSSSGKSSSSSDESEDNVFEEGIIWQPSYGKSVQNMTGGTEWTEHGDADNYGKSTVVNTFGDSYATFKHSLVYQNWDNETGKNLPTPNPYAQSGFAWGEKGALFQDISDLEGLCIVYTSDKEFRLELQSRGGSDSYEDDDFWDVWVPPSDTKRTARLKFSNLPKAWWRDNVTTRAKALKEMRSLSIQSPYRDRVHCYAENVSDCDDVTYKNNIKLYMVAEYDKCPSGDDDFELGEKKVTFKEGILWDSWYGYGKARTFFGDDDEYSFGSDGSGWWYTYSDTSETHAANGASTVSRANGDGYMKVNLKLVYQWGTNEKGQVVPTPYPYAAFGFDWSADAGGGYANLNDLGTTGLCLTYISTKDFDMAIHSYKEADEFHYTLAASASKKTINVKFSDFEAYDWNENTHTLAQALKIATGLHFGYSNTHVGDALVSCDDAGEPSCVQTFSNEIKLYQLGTYGSCK